MCPQISQIPQIRCLSNKIICVNLRRLEAPTFGICGSNIFSCYFLQPFHLLHLRFCVKKLSIRDFTSFYGLFHPHKYELKLSGGYILTPQSADKGEKERPLFFVAYSARNL